jgi:hypothetical protein
MQDVQLGQIDGLTITIKPMAFVGSIFLWVICAVASVGALNLPLTSAILVGLVCMALHWVSGVVHQAGHAIFARQTGYPMTGLVLGTHGGLLSTSLYPANEPALPEALHLHRALGGPFLSLQLTLLGGLLLIAQSQGERGIGWWVTLYFLLENLFVYTVQALIPLGFNDGSVIWRFLRKLR